MSAALLIFDCDGTLVDTEPFYNVAWTAVLNRMGLPWTVEDERRHLMGRPWADAVAIVERALGRKVPADFESIVWTEVQAEFAKRPLQAVDGVAEALGALRGPRCVASSNWEDKVRESLATTGLGGFFDPAHIFVAAMVKRGKPAPDLFLHAAATMGAAPMECVVIEDSVPGVQAGVAAGMRVLGYAGPFTDPEGLAAAGAELFDDMRRLPALLA